GQEPAQVAAREGQKGHPQYHGDHAARPVQGADARTDQAMHRQLARRSRPDRRLGSPPQHEHPREGQNSSSGLLGLEHRPRREQPAGAAGSGEVLSHEAHVLQSREEGEAHHVQTPVHALGGGPDGDGHLERVRSAVERCL
ncbi:unnamed protein product, partial [Prorocentrum cordatum]